MKKLLALLLAGALSLSMSACCCCIPMNETKTPALQNSTPTSNVIIQIPTDPTEPTNPSTVLPTTPPTVPVAPVRKEVTRCVFASYQDGEGNAWFRQRLMLADNFFSQLEMLNYDGTLSNSYLSYDWDARTATITSDDSESGSQTFLWDEKGQIVQIIGLHEGELLSIQNSYTPFGEILERRIYLGGKLESRSVYEYDENEKPIKFYAYDADGVIIEQAEITYNEYGDVTRELYWLNGELDTDYRYTYTYDEEGRKLTETAVFGEEDRFVHKYSYHYNAQGLLDLEYSFDEAGYPNYWYEYSYNEKGDEVLSARYDLDGICDTYTTEYNEDGYVLRRSSYSHYDGSPVLQNVELFEYSKVYVTELEDAVQQNLFDLIMGWSL